MTPMLIKADGTTVDYPPENGTDFTLAELQKAVGGFIEIVSLEQTRIFVINEEGKLNGLPVNVLATTVAREMGAIFPWDSIVGDVVYCHNDMVK